MMFLSACQPSHLWMALVVVALCHHYRGHELCFGVPWNLSGSNSEFALFLLPVAITRPFSL